MRSTISRRQAVILTGTRSGRRTAQGAPEDLINQVTDPASRPVIKAIVSDTGATSSCSSVKNSRSHQASARSPGMAYCDCPAETN